MLDGMKQTVTDIMMKPSKINVCIAVVTVQLVFCGWAILAKVSMSGPDAVNPIVFAFYREMLGTAVMLGIAWHSDGFCRPHIQDVPRFLLLGFCCFAAIYGFLLALRMTSATDASMIQPLNPVMAVIFGTCMGIEELTTLRVLGVFLCAVGSTVVTVMSSTEDEASAPHTPEWMLLLFFCCCASAVLFLAQKAMLNKYPTTSVTAWYYTTASLLTACAATPEMVQDPSAFARPFEDSTIVLALCYAVIFATVINYEVLSWANKHTASSTVMSFSAIQPIGTALLAYFTLNTDVHLGQVGGGFIIIVGLLLVLHSSSIENTASSEELGENSRQDKDCNAETDALLPSGDGEEQLENSDSETGNVLYDYENENGLYAQCDDAESIGKLDHNSCTSSQQSMNGLGGEDV